MLPGVKVLDLKKFPDERGSFSEVARMDWDFWEGAAPAQVNLSVSYPSMVRAWHKHEGGQVDYFIVSEGSLKVCAFDEDSREMSEVVITADKLQMVRIPGNYWHGTKAVSPGKTTTIYFVSKTYDHKNPDELRRQWDYAFVPKTINGDAKDPRCGKNWDWFFPPHK